MNSILTSNSELSRVNQTKPSKDVETTGSVAMNNFDPLFNIPAVNYDLFIPTNPFSLNIDFGNYAEQEAGTLANNSLFMQGFANAMATLSENSSGFGGGECASVASAASSPCSAGSCSVGGGFTSVG